MNETYPHSQPTLSGDQPETVIGPLNKGLGLTNEALTRNEIVQRKWNLLHEDLSLPTAVLYEERLQHNLEWMQGVMNAYGVKLAPHGKTTMAPKLFERQIQSGAWGITLATPHQTQVAYAHGVRRILMANQLVGKANMRLIADLLRDETFEFYCLIDSAQQVRQIGEFFQARQQRLKVLIELGVAGGRCGVRDASQLQELLGELNKWRQEIAVCGIEVYEGVLEDESSIRSFLQRAVDVTRTMVQQKRFDRDPVLLSGAGSAWYDVVAEMFSVVNVGSPVEIILRPGCYITHDIGVYEKAQQEILSRNPIAQKMRSGLKPALQLWAYVQSVPEKEKAILTLGKRDAAFDAGLPRPALHFRPGNAAPVPCSSAWRLARLMDQHAYMEIAENDDVRVGDMVGLDISHPCLTFDKWRYLPILDGSYQVVDVVQTYF
jgi:D-serine dehydratase